MALVFIAALVLLPAVSAGFVLVDDHEILSFAPLALSDPELARPTSLLDVIFISDPASGRVRPLYYTIRYAEIALLGPNPQAWHLLYVAFGALSAIVFYTALHRIGIARPIALMSAAWLTVSPGVSDVWIRLGPAESLGTLLLVVAVWALTHTLRPNEHAAWSWLLVASACASSLIKESFALVPPALLLLRLVLLYAQYGRGAVTIRSALWPMGVPVAVGGVVLALAFVTVRLSPINSYGSGYLEQSTAGATAGNLRVLALLGGVTFLPLIVSMSIEILRQRKLTHARRVWLGGGAVICLLVLPQLILYQHQPAFVIGRYLLPAGLGVAGGFAAGAHYLRSQRQRLRLYLVAEVWLLILCFGGVRTWLSAETLRGDSAALAGLIQAIARSSPIGGTIAIAADPAAQYEEAMSFPYLLVTGGRQDLDLRLIMTPSEDPRVAWLAPQLSDFYLIGRPDGRNPGCADIGAVIVLSDRRLAERVLPCLTTMGLHVESFSETASLNLALPGFVRTLFPSTTTSYSALLR